MSEYTGCVEPTTFIFYNLHNAKPRKERKEKQEVQENNRQANCQKNFKRLSTHNYE